MIIPLLDIRRRRPGAAIFLSGSGSNAEKLLVTNPATRSWQPLVLVTDRPETSRARALAAQFSLPLVELDIAAFYRARGEQKVSLRTVSGRGIRAEWTDELRRLLQPYPIDFGILAGFVPLTNITSDFPCLNVHPGDLTYRKDGIRYLVGLHTLPLERALLEGLTTLRSSVILAQTYTGGGGEMDSGPVLGVSAPIPAELAGYSREQLLAIARARPERLPPGGCHDALTALAERNLEQLKQKGDWVIFPPVVDEFARGNYGVDASGQLYYRHHDHPWQPVLTIEFDADGGKRLLPPTP
ncbi:MAG: hypothetical protein PHQ27_05390 [Victivallales bacterium]|nr:hypothetical protein [Victivallales bacterium]